MPTCTSISDHPDLLEALAEVEYRQWIHWSQSVATQVSPEVLARWRASWSAYTLLPESLKELDRVWARQVLELLRKHKLL